MALVTMVRPPFVMPMDMVNQQQGTPPLGMAYLLASLKAHGHEVSGIDAFGEDVNRCTKLGNAGGEKGLIVCGIRADEIVERIPTSTDLIAMTCMFSNEWVYTRYIINKIKKRFPHVPIIAGTVLLLLIGYLRRWSRWVMIVVCVLAAWSTAALAVQRLVVNINDVPNLPTERFLQSGVGRVLDM